MFKKVDDKFSIRKTKIAVGSVAIASVFMVASPESPIGITQVQAAEVTSQVNAKASIKAELDRNEVVLKMNSQKGVKAGDTAVFYIENGRLSNTTESIRLNDGTIIGTATVKTISDAYNELKNFNTISDYSENFTAGKNDQVITITFNENVQKYESWEASLSGDIIANWNDLNKTQEIAVKIFESKKDGKVLSTSRFTSTALRNNQSEYAMQTYRSALNFKDNKLHYSPSVNGTYTDFANQTSVGDIFKYELNANSPIVFDTTSVKVGQEFTLNGTRGSDVRSVEKFNKNGVAFFKEGQEKVRVKSVSERLIEFEVITPVAQGVNIHYPTVAVNLKDPSKISADGKQLTGTAVTFTRHLVKSNKQNKIVLNEIPVTGLSRDGRGVLLKGSASVEYVTDKGTVLKARANIKEGVVVGTEYRTEALTFPDKVETFKRGNQTFEKTTKYVLKAQPANAFGRVSDGHTEIKYVYQEISSEKDISQRGSVTVKFVDEHGKEIQNAVTLKNNEVVGTNYTLTDNIKSPTLIKNNVAYTFTKVTDSSAPVAGVVTDADQVITLAYTSAKEATRTENGTTVLKFVDEAGKEIKQSITEVKAVENIKERTFADGKKEVLSTTPTNANYDFNAHKQDVIEVNGVKYQLKEVKGNLTGKVAKGTNTVTLSYARVVTSKTPSQGVPVLTQTKGTLAITNLYNPKGGEITVDKGTAVTDAELVKLITGLPKDSKEFSTKVINKVTTDKAGVYNVSIEITYSDGSKDTVVDKVTVVEKTNTPAEGVPHPTANKGTIAITDVVSPKGQVVKTTVGTNLTDAAILTGVVNGPKATDATFKVTKPSTDKPGEFEATVDITYTDGSKDTVKVPVLVSEPAPKVSLPTLEVTKLFNPQGGAIIVDRGTAVTDADMVKLITGLPKDSNDYTTKVTNKVPTDIPGVYEITVEVTYKDGSKDTVTNKVTVKEQTATPAEGVPHPTAEKGTIAITDLFNPQGGETTVDKGSALTDADLIKLVTGLPKDSKDFTAKVTDKVSTDVPGVFDVKVEITYTDGSKDTVTNKVTVKEQTATPKEGVPHPTVSLDTLAINHLFTPEGGEFTVDKDTQVSNDDVFKHITGLPENKDDFKLTVVGDKVPTETPGVFDVKVEITYSDGTVDEATVKMTVVEKTATPKEGVPHPTVELSALPITAVIDAEGGKITVDKGASYEEGELFATIKGIPEGTKAEFKLVDSQPSTENPGLFDAKVQVTYEDGSTDEVVVQVEVKDVVKPATELPPIETVTDETPAAVVDEAPVVEDTPAPVQEAPVQETPASYNPYEAKQTPNTGASSIALAGLALSSVSLPALALLKKKEDEEK